MQHILATPSWFNVDNVKNIAIGALAGLAGVTFLIVRFVQKMALKIGMAVVCVGLGVAVYTQRANLNDCAQKCKCTVFGQDVKLTGDALTLCQQKGKTPSVTLPS